jgi:hypothetical protein
MLDKRIIISPIKVGGSVPSETLKEGLNQPPAKPAAPAKTDTGRPSDAGK